MKKIIFTLIFIGIFQLTSIAQKIDLYGYFESQLMGAHYNEEFYHTMINKLRVDLASSFSENLTFAANFDYIANHGKTEWNILDFLSNEITRSIPEEEQGLYQIRFNDRTFLDNAYLKIAFDAFDLTVGKQQISLGTGYVWNPTDVFNIKDVLDPSYEQPGHNALLAEIPIGLNYNVTLIYAPDDNWKNSAKLIRFKGRLSHFDYSFYGIEKEWVFHDYSQFDPQKMGFAENVNKRQMLGFSTAGELLDMGLWCEYGYNFMDRSGDFYELVVGADHTFDFETYIMLEYYRNSLAKNDYTEYTITDWMRSFSSEIKTVTRDQIYGIIQHPVTDYINIGLSTIYSISDQSLAIIPTMNYSYSSDLEFVAYLNFNLGREGTTYSTLQGNGGLLRARVYF